MSCASVEDYNHEMFSEGGGDTTFLVLNAPTPSTSQDMIPDGMGKKKNTPLQTEYIPIFDPMQSTTTYNSFT